MKESTTIFSHLFELGRLMRRRMSVAVPLSMPQVETLHFVAEGDCPTMRQLADYLKIQAPSATALVAELVRAGLLRRKTEGADRRRITLALTPRGKKLFDETLRTRKRVVAGVLSGLTSRERVQFDHLLTVIIKANRE
jgi:DNA-binding MarR family transcriptional regulator